jgi:hypothetical protein
VRQRPERYSKRRRARSAVRASADPVARWTHGAWCCGPGQGRLTPRLQRRHVADVLDQLVTVHHIGVSRTQHREHRLGVGSYCHQERAALAARAYIRHRHTHYEDQLLGIELIELDDDIDAAIVEVEEYRAIKQTAQRDVDNFLETHRRRV